ncbi:MAG TPA: hypothetical protein VF881_07925 [Polyangiaceae bacterium]
MPRFDPYPSRRVSSLFPLVALAWLAATSGCATRASVADAGTTHVSRSSAADLTTESPNAIVSVHRSKCGACHMPVAPGSLARATAEATMLRHRRRAKLSEKQWTDMVDYLSEDGALHGRHTARFP